jgi:hypothetical protein
LFDKDAQEDEDPRWEPRGGGGGRKKKKKKKKKRKITKN